MVTRAQVVDVLGAELIAHGFVRAATLGGSDANGRADDVSDVDVVVFVAVGAVEGAVVAVERAIERVSPIAARWRVPMPSWHGCHQAFYQLADAPEHLMVDALFVEVGPGAPAHSWFEVERHGVHRVLFDKDGVVVPRHVDRAAIDAAVAKKVAELRVKHRLFRHLPGKLAVRGGGGEHGQGLPADAAYFYHALLLRQLVDLLRAVFCPERHDFGFRYLKDDLPPREYALVCRLSYPRGVADVAGNSVEIAAEFERVLAVWDGK